MNSADESHSTARERSLIITEKGSGASQCDREFLAVNGYSEVASRCGRCPGVLKHRQNRSSTVGDRDDHGNVQRFGGVFDDLLDFSSGERDWRRRWGIGRRVVDTAARYQKNCRQQNKYTAENK